MLRTKHFVRRAPIPAADGHDVGNGAIGEPGDPLAAEGDSFPRFAGAPAGGTSP